MDNNATQIKTKTQKRITEPIDEDEDNAYYDDLYLDKSIDGFQMIDVNNNEVKIKTNSLLFSIERQNIQLLISDLRFVIYN